MFILFAVGGVGQPTNPDEVDRLKDKRGDTSSESERSTYTVARQEEDSFVPAGSRPQPSNEERKAEAANRDKHVDQCSRRDIKEKLECEGFDVDDEQKDLIAEHLATNPHAREARHIRLVRGREINAESRQEMLQSFLQQTLDSEELAEIAKARAQRNREAQELERVFIAMSFGTSNPVSAISSLKNLLGSLDSSFAQSIAAGGISQIMSFATEWALKEARETGKADFMTALKQAVSGAVPAVATNRSESIAAVAIEGSAPTTPVITTEEVFAVDENNNVIDVFYITYVSEESNRAASDYVASAVTEAANGAKSGEIDAQRAASERREEIQATGDARATLAELNYEERHASGPAETTGINNAKSTAMRRIANA